MKSNAVLGVLATRVRAAMRDDVPLLHPGLSRAAALIVQLQSEEVDHSREEFDVLNPVHLLARVALDASALLAAVDQEAKQSGRVGMFPRQRQALRGSLRVAQAVAVAGGRV